MASAENRRFDPRDFTKYTLIAKHDQNTVISDIPFSKKFDRNAESKTLDLKYFLQYL